MYQYAFKRVARVFTLAALSSIAIGVWAQPAMALTKITYGTVTSVVLSQTIPVAAKGLGFFKDEGLDVNIVPFNGTATLLPQIANGRVQVGYPNPSALIISREPGKDRLPIEYFYNATRAWAWEFVVLADSPVKKITDLKGKQVGVGSLTWGNIPLTRAIFKEFGMEVGKDVQLVPVGVGAPAFLALRRGKIAALNSFDSQMARLEVEGTKIRRLPLPQKYSSLFSNGFVASEDTIKNHPEILAKFGRAIAKASVYCEANTAACIKIFWKLYPNRKPTSGDEETNVKNAVKIFDARFKRYLDFGDSKKRLWGQFPAQPWKDYVDALYEGGQLTTKNIPVETCYTNKLVPEFNKFDAAAIVKEARAAK